MPSRVLLALALLPPLSAQTGAEAGVIAVLQRFFDALAANDGDGIRRVMLPDATVHSIREGGEPAGAAVSGMADRISAGKASLRERFTARPRVLIRGKMAQLWGEYSFHRDGKFSHCGVDSAILFLTSAGWKIAALAYTVETAGCPGPS